MTQLDRSLLRMLAGWDPGDVPITSVSLSVDGRAYPRKADVEVRLDELIRRARSQAEDLDRRAARSVERDTAAMSAFVRDGFDRGSTRGLAMFSASEAGLWEAVQVPRPLMHRAVVARDADLLPLEMLLQTHHACCVALVDYEKARLFVIEMGAIEEIAEVVDDVPGRHDQGGWAQMRMQRHVDDHRFRHLKRVADRLMKLWRRRRFEHLILAGPAEAHRELEGGLHDYLRRRVRDHAVLPMTATATEVLGTALELEERAEADTERAVLERLDAAIGGHDGGVTGVERTLEALSNGRVGELVVSRRASSPGRRCPACGRLTARRRTCASCGTRTAAVTDVVEAAVAQAYRSGARVETIGDDDAMRPFEGVGALLRF